MQLPLISLAPGRPLCYVFFVSLTQLRPSGKREPDFSSDWYVGESVWLVSVVGVGEPTHPWMELPLGRLSETLATVNRVPSCPLLQFLPGVPTLASLHDKLKGEIKAFLPKLFWSRCLIRIIATSRTAPYQLPYLLLPAFILLWPLVLMVLSATSFKV